MQCTHHPYTTAIILAGGTGSRMNADGLPKQLMILAGEPVLLHTLRTFDQLSQVDYIVVVVKEDIKDIVEKMCRHSIRQTPFCVTLGGATRMESAKAGQAVVPSGTKFIALHDAARCLVHPSDVITVLEKAYETGAATLASSMTDTIKTIGGFHQIKGTIPRESVVAVQTPQVFSLQDYRAALLRAETVTEEFTDDNQIMELAGHSISVVISQYPNPKLTYPNDLEYAEYILTKQTKHEGESKSNDENRPWI